MEENELNLLISEAEEGNTVSQYELGLFYENGENVEQSYEKAIYWYKQVLKEYHGGGSDEITLAAYQLANLYYTGTGVGQSKEKALHLFVKSLESDAVKKIEEILSDDNELALKELEYSKKLFDLGLIDEEDFSLRMAELKKYIY